MPQQTNPWNIAEIFFDKWQLNSTLTQTCRWSIFDTFDTKTLADIISRASLSSQSQFVQGKHWLPRTWANQCYTYYNTGSHLSSINHNRSCFCAFIPQFSCTSHQHYYQCVPSMEMSDVCVCGAPDCSVVICNVNMWLCLRASLPLRASWTHTHAHTIFREQPAAACSAPLLRLSHNCSRASPLLVQVCPSQAANHEQPSWLAEPPASNRPLDGVNRLHRTYSTVHCFFLVLLFFLSDLFIYGPQCTIAKWRCSVDQGRVQIANFSPHRHYRN